MTVSPHTVPPARRYAATRAHIGKNPEPNSWEKILIQRVRLEFR
jgi:hypothetical protein